MQQLKERNAGKVILKSNLPIPKKVIELYANIIMSILSTPIPRLISKTSYRSCHNFAGLVQKAGQASLRMDVLRPLSETKRDRKVTI